MNPHDILFRRLVDFGPLCPSMRHELSQRFTTRNLPRRKLLFKPGTTPRTACFVVSGLLKAYGYTQCGQREVEGFVWEGEFVHFPADNLEAVEDCLLLEVPHQEVEWLYTHHPQLERTARLLTERYLKERSVLLQILRLTKSTDRLRLFLSYYPDLAPRLKRQDLASYLHLSPCTLSRILAGEVKY